MKILHIIFTTTGYKASGAVTAALSLAAELNKSLDVVVLIMNDEDDFEQNNEMSIYKVKSSAGILDKTFLPKRIKNLFVTAKFDTFIKKENPDLIHFHNPVPPLAVYKTARWCKKNKFKYVMTSHGFNEIINFSVAFQINIIWHLFVKILVHVPLKNVLRNASCLFLLSKYEVKDVQNYLGSNKINHAVTPNGYPSDLTSFKTKNIEKWKYLFSDNRPAILFLGNHTRNKGIDVLLNCSDDLVDNCRIIIGGKTRLKNGTHHFMGRNKTNISKNVIFTEFLSDEEKYFLLEKCDILVHPTRADTLPLAIIEGMFFEKAVISTTVGGIPSLIDEETGILVPPGDSKLLAKAINELLKDPIKSRNMGLKGKQKVLCDFSWEKSAKTTISLYNKLIS
jgi:alpha-maltose-1-phosphate synthase